MALTVRTIEYFNTRIQDAPGKAYEILAQLASEDINLLAFSAVPFGPNHVELTIFPDKGDVFQALASTLGWSMTGPQHACLVQGDDHLGALAGDPEEAGGGRGEHLRFERRHGRQRAFRLRHLFQGGRPRRSPPRPWELDRKGGFRALRLTRHTGCNMIGA